MIKVFLTAAVVAMAAAGPATAEPDPATYSVSVPYADLDLHSEIGRARLRRRLDAAVRSVCRKAYSGGLYEVRQLRRCIVDTAAETRLVVGAVLARAERQRLASSELAGR